MTLQQRLEAFATAVKNKINAMMPRLLPQGGTAGQSLVKSTANDYDSVWTTITKSSVGLENVENKSSATIRSEITASDITDEVTSIRPRGISFSYAGKPSASERIVASANYAFTITQGKCTAIALVAATAQTVFTIRKKGASAPITVGTVTFSAAGTLGTFSITSGSISDTESVWIESPATPDATLADIGVTIKE